MEPRITNELIQAAGAALVAAQVLRLRLVRLFPALWGYVILLATMDSVFIALDYRSRAYLHAYIVLEPVKAIFSILAVRELLALIFQNYPGIRTAGRWAMYAGITLAVSLSLAVAPWAGGPHFILNLSYLEAAQRWLIFTLAVMIGMILWSLSRFPLHLSRNTLLSSTFFSILFLGDAVRLLIDGLMPYLHNTAIDGAEAIFSGLCLLTWACLLRREDGAAPTRVTFTTPRESYLLQQLTAFNRIMTRAARR